MIELEKKGAIKKIKNKIIIDRAKFYFSKPEDSIKRISRFLSILTEMCKSENVLSNKITSEELELIIKDNFSYIWKLYYEMQIPMIIRYKKIFKDIETFHIFALCVVNAHLYARKEPFLIYLLLKVFFHQIQCQELTQCQFQISQAYQGLLLLENYEN